MFFSYVNSFAGIQTVNYLQFLQLIISAVTLICFYYLYFLYVDYDKALVFNIFFLANLSQIFSTNNLIYFKIGKNTYISYKN